MPKALGATCSLPREPPMAYCAAGLSPRVRGNHHETPLVVADSGSIPASAGKPRRRVCPAAPARVYPRECGETCRHGAAGLQVVGLSPRVRGNRIGRSQSRNRRGSIPASAGKPRRGRLSQRLHQVYPRECGETGGDQRGVRLLEGLSPRVRGNPGGSVLQAPDPGSIPASAGKPPCPACPQPRREVYPRECGETPTATLRPDRPGGLSPRVRGNRGSSIAADEMTGSIPASAGKPPCNRRRSTERWVYPRECGETCSRRTDGQHTPGLSPRVRGNRGEDEAADVVSGSIPASAGKPAAHSRRRSESRVYPRECGETIVLHCTTGLMGGLSPRVRGNLPGRPSLRLSVGSIPASAGKPPNPWVSVDFRRVYPRECGETCGPLGVPRGSEGLSPRVRGNRRRMTLMVVVVVVYPRECGETPRPAARPAPR